MLTQERLKQLLSYDPETGDFLTIVPAPGRPAGSIAGCLNKHIGYLVIRIDAKLYYCHRLACLYMTGEWPSLGVDHKDGDRINNRWANLRAANQSQNGANQRRPNTNTSGFKGVSFFRQTKRWKAQIVHQGRNYALGYYATPEEAHGAYCEAARRLHGEFARAS